MEISVQLLKRRIAAALPTPAALSAAKNSKPKGASDRHGMVDISDLSGISDDEQFLKEAYRLILGRECDASGFVNYLELLRRHVPRRSILLRLTNSDEARKRGVMFTGLQLFTPAFSGESRFSSMRALPARFAATARDLVRRVLFTRFDSIDHKLTFLLREVTAQTDTLTAKTDASLWTLSEKIDTYIADIVQQNYTIRELLENNSAEIRTLKEIIANMQQENFATRDQLANHSAEIRELVLESQTNVIAKVRPPIVAAASGVLVTELEGFIVGVPGSEWRMAAYYAFRGPMEPGVTKLFRTLIKPGDVVIDIGANVGVYTLLSAELLKGNGKVHSFEPTPETYRILKENVQVNGFWELGIVELHQMAVADQAGMSRLWTFSRDCGHNTLFSDTLADGAIEVTTGTLDEALATAEHVDLVKIDAEGAEPLVFRGMKKTIQRNPNIKIILEFAPAHLRRAGFDPSAVLESFTCSNFEIHRIHDETGELLQATNEQLCGMISTNILLTRKR